MINLNGFNNQKNSSEFKNLNSLNLSKGMSLDLTKRSNLKNVRVGLGWNSGINSNFDLDASALLLNDRGLVNDSQDVIFYNQLDTGRGVVSLGDNRVGSNSSEVNEDDEVILVDLKAIPNNVKYILFIVTIYDAKNRRQNFAMMQNAYIRIIDEDTGEEQCKYNISENFSFQISCEIAKLERNSNGGWNFIPIGEGSNETLEQVLIRYGVR